MRKFISSQTVFVSRGHFPDTALPATYPEKLECVASSLAC
ncbi:uncharacterized, partial [Tachysurus ichikawai]